MNRSNRIWLPSYLHPQAYLPKVQETATLFSKPPYLFADFVGRALRFLQGEQAGAMGFRYDPANILPCRWKCADESLFGVDLAIYAQTGEYPFDKGLIGGRFNAGSLGAAVHHGGINIDFGGSHVGYFPGPGGGRFGHVFRPLCREISTDCGAMMGYLAPFLAVYRDACENIQVFRPAGEKVLVSIPNEFIQPGWSSQPVKLLIDSDTLTAGTVPYQADRPHTHTPIGRTLFYLQPELLGQLSPAEAARYTTPRPTPMGRHLTHHFFNIYDSRTELDEHGLPADRLALYLKYIVSAQRAPAALKVAIVNTNLEHNRLTDSVRDEAFRPFCFASFSGVFIDTYDEDLDSYVNYFQPLGLAIKPADATQTVELEPEEIRAIIDANEPAPPVRPLHEVLGYHADPRLVERFSFRPGHFES